MRNVSSTCSAASSWDTVQGTMFCERLRCEGQGTVTAGPSLPSSPLPCPALPSRPAYLLLLRLAAGGRAEPARGLRVTARGPRAAHAAVPAIEIP